MILIDAIYINTGGGKTLLDYLIQELEKTNETFFYLLDKRIEDKKYSIKETNKVIYLKSGFFDRVKFYKNNKHTFRKVFCFGNVPPPIRLETTVYTYFHNTTFISIPVDFSFKDKIITKIKQKIINFWRKNTDKWLVQTTYVKNKMCSIYKEKETKVELYPFYRELNTEKRINEKEYTFFYVSNAYANKNHYRLVEAFCNFFDKHHKSKLILTVSDMFPETKKMIDEKVKNNYPIKNLGYVSQEVLKEYYRKSEYVIFPSCSESFGLGLLEGIEFGCKIIGANLPYTYAVCQPSVVFEPLSVASIEQALEKTLKEDIPESKSKMTNQINELIHLLTN